MATSQVFHVRGANSRRSGGSYPTRFPKCIVEPPTLRPYVACFLHNLYPWRHMVPKLVCQLKPHGKCSKLEQQEGWHKMKSTERISLTQFANHLDKQMFGTVFKNMVINDN